MASAANGDLIMEQMANAAQLMCAYACCFPPADEMAWRIPKGVGGPMALGETATAWKSGAAALQEIQIELREQTDALGEETWRGKDRDAFDLEISSLLAELGDSHNTAEAIGITLEVLSPFLAVWPPLCMTAGLAVAACATAFYAAAASGIGDIVGASEAAYGIGLSVAEVMSTALSVAEVVLTAALGVAEAVIAAAVFTDVLTQKGHGDSAIVGDLGQAEVDGLGQVAVNLAQYGVSRALDGKKPGESGAPGEGGVGDEGGESTPPSDTAPTDTAPTDTAPTDTAPTDTEPGSGDTPPSDTEPGSGDGDGDGGKTPAETGAERGQDRGHEVGNEAGKTAVDTAQHQTADRTHAGSRLQSLINNMSGWEGTE